MLSRQILTFIVIAAWCSGCKPKTINLHFHPPQNSRFHVQFNSQGTVSVTFAGKDLSSNIKTGISSLLQVDSITGSRYLFALSYTDFDLVQNIEGKTVDLKQMEGDTSKDSNGIVELLKHISFTGIINGFGKAEQMQPSDSLKYKIDQVLQPVNEKEKQQVLAVIGPLLSNDMAKGMIDQCFYVFPPGKVNIGDSWKNEINMESIFSMVIKTKFTLLEIKDSIALLKVESEISPNKNEVIMPGLAMSSPKGSDANPASNGLNIFGMKLLASFEGTQNGNVWINMKTGIIEKNLLNQDLKGKISISIIDLPMSMKMQTGYAIQPVL
jgi:hypothetical protein